VPCDDSAARRFSILDDRSAPTGRRLVERSASDAGWVTAVDSSYYAFSECRVVMLSATTRVRRDRGESNLLLAQVARLGSNATSTIRMSGDLRASAVARRWTLDQPRNQTYRRPLGRLGHTLDS